MNDNNDKIWAQGNCDNNDVEIFIKMMKTQIKS